MLRNSSSIVRLVCRWWNRLAGIISPSLLFLIALLILVDSGTRAAKVSVQGMTETIMLLLAVSICISLAHTEQDDKHIRVDILWRILGRRTRLCLQVITTVLGMFLLGLFTWATFGDAMTSLGMREYYPGLVRIPVYPVKFAVPLGVGFLALQFLLNNLDSLSALLKNSSQSLEEPKSVE